MQEARININISAIIFFIAASFYDYQYTEKFFKLSILFPPKANYDKMSEVIKKGDLFMNTKRWVAVVLAVVVLILSFGSGSLKSKINREQDQKIVNSFTKNFTSVFEKMNENVLEMGNPSVRIAVIHLNGVISAQSSTSILSGSTYNHDLFMNELHQIYNDPTVQAVLLVVNSPGGGVYESAEIHRTLEAIIRDKEIPLYVSMQNMAASGGYYVSAPAQKIFATPDTITGSIGVIIKGTNLSGLYEKFGIKEMVFKSGTHKDIMSTSREMTQEEQKIMQKMIDNSYERFLDVIVKGRGIDKEKLRKLADGRIYDGAQAKEVGLVDELGFKEDALAALKASDSLLNNAQVFEYNPAGTLLDQWLKKLPLGSKTSEITELLNKFPIQSAPVLMYYYGGM
ncbi:signal peptide peptidase SppA [Peptostreptococcaceae bacterium oral taxon 113 str. W5053]|nr:signal peptide peptidase SppA [Peptostreptococcaceae bacterium oral taxon 113 str. W5053]